MNSCQMIVINTIRKQAGTELCQAQHQLELTKFWFCAVASLNLIVWSEQMRLQLQATTFCPWTNVVCKNVAQTDVAWTNVARTDVAWTNDAWTNVDWSNGSGPLVNSQGWFHKHEMSSTVLSLGGWGGKS